MFVHCPQLVPELELAKKASVRAEGEKRAVFAYSKLIAQTSSTTLVL